MNRTTPASFAAMSLAKLTKLSQELGRKTAYTIWLRGHVFKAAQEKCKTDKTATFSDWCKEGAADLSTASIYRYIKVANSLPDAPPEDKTVIQVYTDLGLYREPVKRQKMADATPTTAVMLALPPHVPAFTEDNTTEADIVAQDSPEDLTGLNSKVEAFYENKMATYRIKASVKDLLDFLADPEVRAKLAA